MIKDFFVTLFMVLILFSIWNNLNEEKMKWLKLRSIIVLLGTSVLILLNYYTVNVLSKIINSTIIFIVSYKNLYNKKINDCIVAPFLIELLILISETLFSFMMFLIFKNNVENYVNSFQGSIIANISISMLTLLLSKIPIVKKIYLRAKKLLSSLDEVTVIFYSLITLFTYSIFIVNTYKLLNSSLLLLFSLFIVILSVILTFMFFKLKYDYYKINNNYNNSLMSLKELENALTNHRIDNHENKNQLMTIRNMTKNKKVISFIDSILDNKMPDDKRIMKETSVIPSGGLRGIVYSKVLLIANKNIEYELNLSNSICTIDILDYGNETMLDICKIVGIFLDNAIEEVDTIDDKYITIEMYKESDKFVISVSNTYDNSKSKLDIYKSGVTTKGEGHGYGLSLVKKIIKYNNKLKTYNEITENEFIQTLYISK